MTGLLLAFFLGSGLTAFTIGMFAARLPGPARRASDDVKVHAQIGEHIRPRRAALGRR